MGGNRGIIIKWYLFFYFSLRGGEKLEHKEYLEVALMDLNLKLEELRVEHRIAIAVYNAKTELIISERDSIEKQLKENE